MSAERILRDARTLLDDPNAWTQTALVRFDGNTPVAWCLTGAVAECADIPVIDDDSLLTGESAHPALRALERQLPEQWRAPQVTGEPPICTVVRALQEYNDSRHSRTGRKDILALLDDAIRQ